MNSTSEITAFFAGSLERVCLDREGKVVPGRLPQAVLPGSFNPIHAGHWGLADAAGRQLKHEIDFELSIHNVDKPALAAATVLQRAGQFVGRAPLWLTRAPTFLEKARLFPGSVFVVGADTAARIVANRYYRDGAAGVESSLRLIRDCGCRFLVACRIDDSGRLTSLEDLAIPQGYGDLFQALPASEFRFDLSSTQVRGQPS